MGYNWTSFLVVCGRSLGPGRRRGVVLGTAFAVGAYFVWKRRHYSKKRKWPEGLALFESFVTESEAKHLVDSMEKHLERLKDERHRSYSRIPPAFAERSQSRIMLQFGAYTNANRVQATERVEAMPKELEAVADKLIQSGILTEEERPDSCCVNLYERGNWIPPHVDNILFARPFVTVSLCSEQIVHFEFDDIYELRLALPVHSALRVDGDAANRWRHAVLPVTDRRISLTFRRLSAEAKQQAEAARRDTILRREAKAAAKRADKALKRKRKADYKKQLKEELKSKTAVAPLVPLKSNLNARSSRSKPLPENSLNASHETRSVPSLESEHVWKVYEAIAPTWHGTRYKAWPRVAEFAQSVGDNKGALLCDVGCGNGKNAMPLCKGGAVAIACDVSLRLLEIAKRENSAVHYDCMAADAVNLPFRDNSFDACLNIAVLHHISTPARRTFLVAETLRILKPGGRCLFYAWARDQRENEARSGHRFAAADVLVPFHLRQHGNDWHESSLGYLPDHAERDDTKNALVLQRYCHVYDQGDLEELVLQAVSSAECIRFDESYYDQGNWALALTKLSSF